MNPKLNSAAWTAVIMAALLLGTRARLAMPYPPLVPGDWEPGPLEQSMGIKAPGPTFASPACGRLGPWLTPCTQTVRWGAASPSPEPPAAVRWVQCFNAYNRARQHMAMGVPGVQRSVASGPFGPCGPPPWS